MDLFGSWSLDVPNCGDGILTSTSFEDCLTAECYLRAHKSHDEKGPPPEPSTSVCQWGEEEKQKTDT
jgi:hypothetical protein